MLSIPHLTRSSLHRCLHLHRCLQRHGISRLPEFEGDRPARKRFASYPTDTFHIDLAEVSTAKGKLRLFVAIDRMSRIAFVWLAALRLLRGRHRHPQVARRLGMGRCSRQLRSGSCANARSVRIDRVEAAVLGGLAQELRDPAYVRAHLAACREKRERLAEAARCNRAGLDRVPSQARGAYERGPTGSASGA